MEKAECLLGCSAFFVLADIAMFMMGVVFGF
jgi:hypothetical protein